MAFKEAFKDYRSGTTLVDACNILGNINTIKNILNSRTFSIFAFVEAMSVAITNGDVELVKLLADYIEISSIKMAKHNYILNLMTISWKFNTGDCREMVVNEDDAKFFNELQKVFRKQKIKSLGE
jgi:hypothetical protein